MNTCPNCGKMAGLHGSILQGCTCQWSMQSMKEGKDFTISKPWVGLTLKETTEIELSLRQYVAGDRYDLSLSDFARAIEAKLKEKNT